MNAATSDRQAVTLTVDTKTTMAVAQHGTAFTDNLPTPASTSDRFTPA
jgi:hypothetical protein